MVECDVESDTEGLRPIVRDMDDPLREKVAIAYAPLAALYGLFDGRLRERPAEDPAPVGWRPHIEAIRALINGRVHGDPDRLGRLMADPAALTPADAPAGDPADRALDPRVPESVQAAVETGPAHLIHAPEGTDAAAVVREIVRRRAVAGGRTLLLVPGDDALDGALARIGDDQEIFAVRAEPRGRKGRDARGPEDRVPEGRTRTGVIRAVGTSYQQAWESELRALRRELLWLEQWPRDRTALATVRAEHERRRGALSAEEDRLTAQVRERRAVAAAAEREATAVQATRDSLDEDRRRIAEDAAKSRAEWEQFQETADEAARIADERTRRAEEFHARYREHEERHVRCGEELRAARDREVSLVEELSRAKEALPEAIAETERLSAAATQAAAVGHACYYRLAAAESALAAERRKVSWGQRMRIAPAGPDLQRLRRQVAAHTKEADEAATAARRSGEALEKAEAHRARLEAFLAGGDERLATLRAEQKRLGEELVRVAAERDEARAEHRRHAERVPEAVEAAARAGEAAFSARRLSAQTEERLNEAGRAHAETVAEADRTAAEARAAAERLAGAEAELARHGERADAELASGVAEIAAAEDAEARSHRHVEEICGADPAAADETVIADHRTHAMARIERLSDHAELLAEPVTEPVTDDPPASDDDAVAAPGAEPPGDPGGPTGTRALPELPDLPEVPDALGQDPLGEQALPGTKALPGAEALPGATDPAATATEALAETQDLADAEPHGETTASLSTQALPELPEVPDSPAAQDPMKTPPLPSPPLPSTPPLPKTPPVAEIEEPSGEATGENELDLPEGPDPLDELGGMLLETADLVCGTALGVAACPLLATAEFDTLIVAGAGRISVGEFLVGAVRARRWILIGDDDELPAGADEELIDHVHALAVLRAADGSPGTDLDAAVEAVAAARTGDEEIPPARLPAVRAEADRLSAGRLWEIRYRDAYRKALGQAARLSAEAGSGEEPGDWPAAERALLGAMTGGLVNSVFQRCSTAAPGLRRRLVPAPPR